MNKPEIVCLGFPKCGTSALMRAFEADPDCTVLRSETGSLEMSWPTIVDRQTGTPAPNFDS